MNLVNDYFLLYHGITFEQNKEVEEIETKINDDVFSIFALVLSTTRKESTKFLVLDSFKNLCLILNVDVPHNENELYHLQHSILDSITLHKTRAFLYTLHQSFEYLYNEEILSLENYNKLISLFDHQEIDAIQDVNEKDNTQKEKSSFKVLKLTIENIIDELSKTVSIESANELSQTNHYMNNQKFSIGITGVMNAGKSTMLNALMGKEILGSAVVPETANLTIVKHNVTDNAKVYYWNENEWNKIVKSSEELDSMKDFVNETNSVFFRK